MLSYSLHEHDACLHLFRSFLWSLEEFPFSPWGCSAFVLEGGVNSLTHDTVGCARVLNILYNAWHSINGTYCYCCSCYKRGKTMAGRPPTVFRNHPDADSVDTQLDTPAFWPQLHHQLCDLERIPWISGLLFFPTWEWRSSDKYSRWDMGIKMSNTATGAHTAQKRFLSLPREEVNSFSHSGTIRFPMTWSFLHLESTSKRCLF